jgi:hypothetical protein
MIEWSIEQLVTVWCLLVQGHMVAIPCNELASWSSPVVFVAQVFPVFRRGKLLTKSLVQQGANQLVVHLKATNQGHPTRNCVKTLFSQVTILLPPPSYPEMAVPHIHNPVGNDLTPFSLGWVISSQCIN